MVQRSLLAFVCSLVVMTGCSDVRVPVFPVSGKVLYKGKPAAGAQIVLYSSKQSEVDDIAPSATVGTDGNFAITVYEPGDGAPDGDYVAIVQWFKMDGETAGPNVIPKMYGSPKTSPIKLTVAGGPVQIPPINIK